MDMGAKWLLVRQQYPAQYKLKDGDNVIGRHVDANIKCVSLYVSRYHCKIDASGNILKIIDNASANGTFVNHHKLLPNKYFPLNANDIIGLGVDGTAMLNEGYFVFKLILQNSDDILSITDDDDEAMKSKGNSIILTESRERNNISEYCNGLPINIIVDSPSRGNIANVSDKKKPSNNIYTNSSDRINISESKNRNMPTCHINAATNNCRSSNVIEKSSSRISDIVSTASEQKSDTADNISESSINFNPTTGSKRRKRNSEDDCGNLSSSSKRKSVANNNFRLSRESCSTATSSKTNNIINENVGGISKLIKISENNISSNSVIEGETNLHCGYKDIPNPDSKEKFVIKNDSTATYNIDLKQNSINSENKHNENETNCLDVSNPEIIHSVEFPFNYTQTEDDVLSVTSHDELMTCSQIFDQSNKLKTVVVDSVFNDNDYKPDFNFFEDEIIYIDSDSENDDVYEWRSKLSQNYEIIKSEKCDIEIVENHYSDSDEELWPLSQNLIDIIKEEEEDVCRERNVEVDATNELEKIENECIVNQDKIAPHTTNLKLHRLNGKPILIEAPAAVPRKRNSIQRLNLIPKVVIPQINMKVFKNEVKSRKKKAEKKKSKDKQIIDKATKKY